MEDSSFVDVNFVLRDTKASGGDIRIMAWSPEKDLLAAAIADNSVILNRLSWQRIWTVAPQDSAIGDLCWRPDGRVLAVGRCDGGVSLHDVEKGDTLHSFSVNSKVTYMNWIQVDLTDQEMPIKIKANENILPPLPIIEESDANVEQEDVIMRNMVTVQCHSGSPNALSMLLIGDECGYVHLWLSSVLHVFSIHLSGAAPTDTPTPVHYATISHDLKNIVAVYQVGSHLNLKIVSVDLIAQRIQELQHLGRSFSHISSHLKYVNAVITAMYQAWEDVLQLMESKMATYAEKLSPDVTIGDEFLMLLASGEASADLKEFLVEELTSNGLRKLGLSLKHSYDKVHGFASSHMMRGIQGLQYHLCELVGMATWYERFGVLGLNKPSVEAALKILGAFSAKNFELLTVIDTSLKGIEVFFKWLWVVIFKLSNEKKAPPVLSETPSPKSLCLLMDFLQSKFTKREKHSFNFEVVGQYFQDENLQTTQQVDQVGLGDLLKEIGIEETVLMDQDLSLVQLFKKLFTSIDSAFTTVSDKISSGCSYVVEWSQGFSSDPQNLRQLTGGFTINKDHFIYFPKDNSTTTVVNVHLDSKTVEIGFFTMTAIMPPAEGQVLSMKVYSSEYITAAVYCDSEGRERQTTLAQLSTATIGSIPFTSLPSTVMEDIEDVSQGLSQIYKLEGFSPSLMAVSGPRRLACVVSKSSKVVKLFDVEAEPGEDIED